MKEDEINGCNICGSLKLDNIPYINSDFHHLKYISRDIFDKCKISTCYDCGFSATTYVPDKKLVEFYERDYDGPNGPHYIGFLSGSHAPPLIDQRSFAQLLLLQDQVKYSKIKRFCDIGSSYGGSFMSLSQLGARAENFSIEVSCKAVSSLNKNGVNIINANKDLLVDTAYENKFDVVLSSHSLEHFNAENINEIVKNIYKIVNKGGFFICEVPHDDFRLKRKKNDAPHLCFFSRASLEMLLKGAGFSVLKSLQYGNVSERVPRSTVHNVNQACIRERFKRLKAKSRVIFFLNELRLTPKRLRDRFFSIPDNTVNLGKYTAYNEEGSVLRVLCQK